MVVIGVDGGTTKTIALVASLDGCILGAARGAGSNWSGPDVETPMAVVVQTVQNALDQSGVGREDAEIGAFALAGADWPEDSHRRQVVLESHHLARRIVVKNDAFGGLRAGTQAPYGVVIAAGTGANTAVITPDGREWAFGYYQSYGGAIDMSQEAIEAVLRAEDGRGAPTLLASVVLDKLGYACVEDLLRALVAREVSRASKLAICPFVFEAANLGDEAAVELIVKHGFGLAEYATAAIRRFGMQQSKFDVVLAGSLFKGQGPLLLDAITLSIHRVAPHARVLRSRFEPAVGAVLLAYDALGLSVSAAMYARLARTCPGQDFFNTTEWRP
jgi:N-acetylglucosamine kinase-like BadF-type ATPase